MHLCWHASLFVCCRHIDVTIEFRGELINIMSLFGASPDAIIMRADKTVLACIEAKCRSLFRLESDGQGGALLYVLRV